MGSYNVLLEVANIHTHKIVNSLCLGLTCSFERSTRIDETYHGKMIDVYVLLSLRLSW